MIEYLNNIDTELFLLINGANTSFLDIMMKWFSSILFWLPIYILIFYLLYLKYSTKALIVVLFILAAFGLADFTSVHLFKNVFMRLRPCYNPEIMDVINNIVGCGGQYGFISSHAANSASVAGISVLLLSDRFKFIKIISAIWVFLVMYSRIYLGKHYPGDVIVGAIWGLFIAYLIYNLWKFISKKLLLSGKNQDENNW